MKEFEICVQCGDKHDKSEMRWLHNSWGKMLGGKEHGWVCTSCCSYRLSSCIIK